MTLKYVVESELESVLVRFDEPAILFRVMR